MALGATPAGIQRLILRYAHGSPMWLEAVVRHVGLAERDDRVSSPYLGSVLIGSIDERTMKVHG